MLALRRAIFSKPRIFLATGSAPRAGPVCQRDDNPAADQATHAEHELWMNRLHPCQAKGMAVKSFAFAIATAGGLAAAALGAASPAVTAPAGVGTAQDTVDSLQAGGYTVNLKKVGNAPLDKCTVMAVGPDHTASDTATGSLQSASASAAEITRLDGAHTRWLPPRRWRPSDSSSGPVSSGGLLRADAIAEEAAGGGVEGIAQFDAKLVECDI